jgi:signal transduction histidine kinase
VNAAALRSIPLPRAYLGAGLALIALYYALPWDSLGQKIVYDVIGLSSAVAVVLGAVIYRPSMRLPWWLFGAGLLAFTCGDIIFNLYADLWHKDPPIPSAADVFYLAGYPFLTVGLLMLVRRLRSEERRSARLDIAIFIAALGLCQWVFVMDDVVHGGGSVAEKLVALAYPAMDVILMAGLVAVALTPTWRTVAYRYLAASILLLLVADEIYAVAPEKYTGTTWVDSLWLLSYVLWGVAALCPSMVELSNPRRGRRARLSAWRLAFLVAALAAAPALLLYEHIWGGVDLVALAIGSAVLSGLVLARLAGLVRALDRARATERDARAESELAQRLLTEQNRRLREADRLKDEFVALISHDLRTPLTSIMGYVELALEEELTGAQRGYLEVVDRNANRLLRLVNDLLFVASLQAGELVLESEEFDLADVVRQSVTEAEPRAAVKDITLTCEVDEDLPDVHADRGRILQVLDNLVSNALKFTPDGGAVDVSLRSAGDARVRLDVRDSGIGIPAEEQQRLFERFFRASSAVERQLPGTGLGLYIARVIAEAHGGSITVASELGHGSTFSVELPAISVPAGSDSRSHARSRSAHGPAGPDRVSGAGSRHRA